MGYAEIFLYTFSYFIQMHSFNLQTNMWKGIWEIQLRSVYLIFNIFIDSLFTSPIMQSFWKQQTQNQLFATTHSVQY